jgi:hypothetical protein
MPGEPRDWFATSEPTRDHDPTEPTEVDDDVSATGRFDLGRQPTAPVDRTRTIGRYQLEVLLGEGAMGQVWRARDPQLDRAVAIKVVHPSIAASPEASARLRREARAMAKLSHPNVVAVHDAGDDRGRLFVAMELVDGVTLGDRLRGGRPGDWRVVVPLLLAAGRGLAAAHSAGVLHRDFKPDNVLVDRGGRVCVADFGLAAVDGPVAPTRAVGHARARGDGGDLTAAGAVLGTPAYMSPEQLRGEPLDVRSDQFGFCVTLFEALYGLHPFLTDDSMTIAALVDAIDRGALAPVPTPDPVPRWLRAAVVRGLAADSAARWPSMEALLVALAPPSRAPRWLVVALAVAVVAVGLAIAVIARGPTRRSPASPPGALTPTRRFEVSLSARIALAPGGGRLAIATSDRIDVRDLDGPRVWSHIDPIGFLDRVEFFDDDRVRFARSRALTLVELDLVTGAVAELWTAPDWQRWLGRLGDDDLVARTVDGRTEIARRTGGPPLLVNPEPVVVVAHAPRGDRIAFIAERRYHGQLIVVDAGGAVRRSDWLPALTSVAWLDDATLIYGTGTVEAPTLWRLPLAADGFGPPTRHYGAARGWFGQLAVGGKRMVFVDSGATFRSRLVDRSDGGARTRDLDPGAVGAVLAWLDDGSFLVWNRATGGVERHDAAGPVAATAARLDGEIVNATRAGDVLIAALRRDTGRELVAVALGDGRELWRQPPGWARAVRCAGDRAPPCVVIDDGVPTQTLRWLDPASGTPGDLVITGRRLDDVAVADDGRAVLIGDGGKLVRRRDLATGVEVDLDAVISVRAVAFDPMGGALVTGTRANNQYLLVHVDGAGAGAQLLQSRDELLFLPRPAPGGATVSVMGRLFLPILYELPR